MKNSQSIIRLSVLIFLMFGMIQTVFSQSIDSMSKVILDKVEKQYASYETMRYDLVINYNNYYKTVSTTDSFRVSTNQSLIKIENDFSTSISNEKQVIYFDKRTKRIFTKSNTKNDDDFMYFIDTLISILDDYNILFKETVSTDNKIIHILELSLDIDKEIKYQLYIDADKDIILRLDLSFLMAKRYFKIHYTNFEANPTFPDNHFEIKN